MARPRFGLFFLRLVVLPLGAAAALYSVVYVLARDVAFLLGRDRPPRGPVEISVWHPWSGESARDFLRLVDTFNETHPEVRAVPLFAQNDLSSNQKFFLSVAGGVPPDVIFVDGPQVAEWGQRGALEPLNDYVARAGITEDDFWAPCWRQCLWEGKIYALTFGADPNFGFAWNKEVFRDAGLDPERPPETFEEMEEMARRMEKTTPDGRYLRLGLMPWAVYGGANSLFTWGWAMGGRFYDYEKRQITCDDPGVVRALEWMCSFADRLDITRVAAMQQGFGSAEQHPFIVGKLGMMPLHIVELREIKRYAPDLEIGITKLPRYGDLPHSSWVGGWCIGIARGAKHRDEAFEFIRWATTSPEGTTLSARATNSFPGCRRSPVYEEIRADPVKRIYYEILEESQHQRPVIPVQAFYMGELNRAVGRALYKRMTPEEALKEARRRTQERLDRVLARGRTP